jgi:hypothetical protein
MPVISFRFSRIRKHHQIDFHLSFRCTEIQSMARAHAISPQDHQQADPPLWTEALFPAELLLLHASPVYAGFGVPRGGGSAVVLIPGFLCSDAYLMPMHWWLERIGYTALYSL